MNELTITICPGPNDAPDYNGTDFGRANLERAIIVKNGTASGKPTVDLQFVTPEGKRFVAMTTGAILDGLASAVRGAAS